VRAARNIAIILLLALVVSEAPGGGNLARGIVAAITITFLVLIGALAYQLYRQNRLTLLGLSEGSRAIVAGALGAIVLMIAGTDELLDTGLGVFVWFAVLGISAYGLYRVWAESRSL
jgi:hypothetical protein